MSRHSAAALAAGVCVPLALAPFDYWPLGIVAPALLLMALRDCGAGRAAWRAWLFGVAKYGVGVSWVYVSIHQYGGASPVLAAALVIVFAAGLALITALLGPAFALLARGRSLLASALVLAGLWVLLEWLLTWLLTGFPWLFAGYGHLATPLRGFAPVAGVLGVSLACVVTGTVAVYVLAAARARQFPRAGAGAAAVAALWLAGWVLAQVSWVQPRARLDVALVQGNVPQAFKWRAGSAAMIRARYLRLSEPYWGRDLLVWPEAALTTWYDRSTGLLRRLDALGERYGTTLITGIPARERASRARGAVFRNTAIALGTGSGQYVKHRLVPFGEYVPLESLLRGLIEFFDLPRSHAAPGPARQPGLRANGYKVALAICYEIAYPELVRGMALEAGLLVTLSNDSWFGDSIGPSQHMQMARMRALENGRALLRATNDGITAIVDANGDMRARLPRFTQAVLSGEVRRYTGRTPFNRIGSGPAVGFAVLLLLPAVAGGLRARGGPIRRRSASR